MEGMNGGTDRNSRKKPTAFIGSAEATPTVPVGLLDMVMESNIL